MTSFKKSNGEKAVCEARFFKGDSEQAIRDSHYDCNAHQQGNQFVSEPFHFLEMFQFTFSSGTALARRGGFFL